MPPPRREQALERCRAYARLVDEQHERGPAGARRGLEARAQRRREPLRPEGIRDDARGATRAAQREAQTQALLRRARRSRGRWATRRGPRPSHAATAGARDGAPIASERPSRREPPAASTMQAISLPFRAADLVTLPLYSSRDAGSVRFGPQRRRAGDRRDVAPAHRAWARLVVGRGARRTVHAQPRLRRARSARPAPRSSASRSWSSTRSMRT